MPTFLAASEASTAPAFAAAFRYTPAEKFFEVGERADLDVTGLVEVFDVGVDILLGLLYFEEATDHVIIERVEIPSRANDPQNNDQDAIQTSHIGEHVEECVDLTLVVHQIEVHLDRDAYPRVIKLLVR